MDYEMKNEMLRERLRRIAEIAEGALAGQPNEAELCWEHLDKAFGRIMTEIVIHATSDDGEKPGGPHFNAADGGRNELRPSRGETQPPWADDKVGLGCIRGENRISSYRVCRYHCVTVTAHRETPLDGPEHWMGTGTVNGQHIVSFRVDAGSGYANLICRNIRNALVSRCDKNRRRRANKAAARVSPLTPKEELAATVARQKGEEVEA